MTCSAKECLHPCKIRLESLLKIRIWRWLSVKDSPDSSPRPEFKSPRPIKGQANHCGAKPCALAESAWPRLEKYVDRACGPSKGAQSTDTICFTFKVVYRSGPRLRLNGRLQSRFLRVRYALIRKHYGLSPTGLKDSKSFARAAAASAIVGATITQQRFYPVSASMSDLAKQKA